MPESIRATAEFRRIDALPRRAPGIAQETIDELTELLAVRDRCPGWRSPTPEGLCPICDAPLRLRPLQARGLLEIGTQDGGFLPLDVGEGKTLISLLAPYVLGAERPMMILPANLLEKTARERAVLANHWRIPTNIFLVSYQMLGVADHADALEKHAPDALVLDESQKVKNPHAAVTRRVTRYMANHPDTRVVAMTGTIMRRSVRDFAHMLVWALKDNAPVPLDADELEQWASALDEDNGGNAYDGFSRYRPGALLQWSTPDEIAEYGEVIAARRAFRRRLRDTPGVVASADTGTEVRRPVGRPDAHGRVRTEPVRLVVRALRYEVSPVTRRHFEVLRDIGQTPDGWDLEGAAEMWRVSKELAVGYHGVWNPRPPDAWMSARREWFAFVRGVLQRSHRWDSPEHVARACDAGEIPSDALKKWRAVKDAFTPNPVPVWHDDTALQTAAAWMRAGIGGIVWTEHVPFARRLAELTGATYYGAKGYSDDGRFVDDADPRAAVIVSVDANREGRNLQRKWARNLVTCPAEGADLWQQLLGRTHRPGQSAPEVTCDVFLGCAEHAKAWAKAVAGAYAIRDTVGAENKLLIAVEGRDGSSVTWPTRDEIRSWSGAQWAGAFGDGP